jgi:hypothetical protein
LRKAKMRTGGIMMSTASPMTPPQSVVNCWKKVSSPTEVVKFSVERRKTRAIRKSFRERRKEKIATERMRGGSFSGRFLTKLPKRLAPSIQAACDGASTSLWRDAAAARMQWAVCSYACLASPKSCR